MNLLFDFDIVKLLLKNNGGGDGSPNFVISYKTEGKC